MEIEFGKKITTDSYFKGQRTNRQIAYSVPVVIKNKSEALTEIIKAIELITAKQTNAVSITVKADKDYQLKLITTEYETNNVDTPEA